MTRPIIVLGSGGHAKVVLDMLLLQGGNILGMTDRDEKKTGITLFGSIKVLGTDAVLEKFPPNSVELVNAIGAIAPSEPRRKVFMIFKNRGYRFAQVIHPSAIIGREVQLGEGTQVMAGTIIQTGTMVEENCILNTRVSIDHDCKIGAHTHLAPGVTLSGGVKIGEGTHLGTGATVIHNITIGSHALIAAGSLVTEDVPEGAKVRGVPAKPF